MRKFYMYIGTEPSGKLVECLIDAENIDNDSEDPADFFLPDTTNVSLDGEIEIGGTDEDKLSDYYVRG